MSFWGIPFCPLSQKSRFWTIFTKKSLIFLFEATKRNQKFLNLTQLIHKAFETLQMFHKNSQKFTKIVKKSQKSSKIVNFVYTCQNGGGGGVLFWSFFGGSVPYGQSRNGQNLSEADRITVLLVIFQKFEKMTIFFKKS